MKAVIQRVSFARVCVDGEAIGEIGRGFLVLLGVAQGDTEEDARVLAKKTSLLRVFTDENDKMNLSLIDIEGECLVVSQFTLCADVRKGNRPSFTASAPPEQAEKLYEFFMKELSSCGVKKVGHGIFGSDMKVSLLNDGPVTILFDSKTWVRGDSE